MTFEGVQLKDLSDVASQILADPRKIIEFHGNLGAGKTTLIKELCQQLGVVGEMSSPTFGIVNEYESKHKPVYHFDLYRIKNEEELFDIGFEDYLESGSHCFLEWPEVANNILQHYDRIVVRIEPIDELSRRIFVE